MSISVASGEGARIPRDVEPLAAQPDPLSGVDAVDAQLPRGGRAEHGDRLACGAGVEPGAAGDAGVEHGRQVEAGGSYLEAAAVAHRDQRVAVDLLVLHQAGVRQPLDVVQVPDPPGRFERQLRRSAGETLSGLDREQVRAEPVDLREQPRLRGGGQPEDGDDRRRADRDPERRQRGAQRPGAQPHARHAQPVLEPQPPAHGPSETTCPSSTRIRRGS